jgi:predicted transposase/invertase (TIGR01784 family)
LPEGASAVILLDPTLDLVFKLLMVRRPELLEDMLSCTLGRPVGKPTILDPTILGEQVRDKRSVLDLRVSLPDRSRVDLEMQRRIHPALANRLVYYNSRDYAHQLRKGDDYELLTPTTGILWTVEPLLPELDELHSVFKLREELTGTVLSEHFSIHLLQISKLSPQLSLPGVHASDYATQVERWARFFTASSAVEMDCLASENRIMSLAKHTLEQLSQEPEIQYRARIREEEIKLYRMTLVASRLEGEAKGHAEGEAKGRLEGEAKGRLEGQAALLLKLLTLRFGPPTAATRACVAAATSAQLDTWAERVLNAPSLLDVLAP